MSWLTLEVPFRQFLGKTPKPGARLSSLSLLVLQHTFHPKSVKFPASSALLKHIVEKMAGKEDDLWLAPDEIPEDDETLGLDAFDVDVSDISRVSVSYCRKFRHSHSWRVFLRFWDRRGPGSHQTPGEFPTA